MIKRPLSLPNVVVVGTDKAPSAILLGKSIEVTTLTVPPSAQPELDAVSDSPHVLPDPESAPNTRTVVLRGMSLGTANVTFTMEGQGSTTIPITVNRLDIGPVNPKPVGR